MEQRTNLLERICSLRGLQSTDYSSSEVPRTPISEYRLDVALQVMVETRFSFEGYEYEACQ